MALLIENTSKSKVIGIGVMTLLPGESGTVPDAFENNPVLSAYVDNGFATVTMVQGKHSSTPAVPSTHEESDADVRDDTDEKKTAEALRKARLASLKTISDEELGKLAVELNVNPADCKDTADMKKRVREALKA